MTLSLARVSQDCKDVERGSNNNTRIFLDREQFDRRLMQVTDPRLISLFYKFKLPAAKNNKLEKFVRKRIEVSLGT